MYTLGITSKKQTDVSSFYGCVRLVKTGLGFNRHNWFYLFSYLL